MGLKDWEEPIHSVSLSSFWMDTIEVTQAQYQATTGTNPSQFQTEKQFPVEKVSWIDAALFCNARSKQDGLDTVYSASTWEAVIGFPPRRSGNTPAGLEAKRTFTGEATAPTITHGMRITPWERPMSARRKRKTRSDFTTWPETSRSGATTGMETTTAQAWRIRRDRSAARTGSSGAAAGATALRAFDPGAVPPINRHSPPLASGSGSFFPCGRFAAAVKKNDHFPCMAN